MLNKKLTLASWISISRVVVFFIFVIVDYYNVSKILCFSLLVYIIFSDWLDGFVARKFKQVSELGKILDPIADKIVFSFGALYFYLKYNFPIWIFLILFIRDILILIFGYYFKEKFKDVPVSNIWGKLSTTFLSLAFFVFYFGYSQYIFLLGIGLFFLFFSSFIYLREVISKIDNTIVKYVNLFGIMFTLLFVFFIVDFFIFKLNKYILLLPVIFLFLIFTIYLLFQIAFLRKRYLELNSNDMKNSLIIDLNKVSFHNIANMLTSFSLKFNMLEKKIKLCKEIKVIKYISDKINQVTEIDSNTKKEIISLVDKTYVVLDEIYNKIEHDLVFLNKKFSQINNQLLQYQYVDNNIKRGVKRKIPVIVKDVLKIFENSFQKRDIKIKVKYIIDEYFELEYYNLYCLVFNLFDFLKSFFDDIGIIDEVKELELDININRQDRVIIFNIGYEFDDRYYDIIHNRVNKANDFEYFVKFQNVTKKIDGTFTILENFNNLRIIMKIPYKTG